MMTLLGGVMEVYDRERCPKIEPIGRPERRPLARRYYWSIPLAKTGGEWAMTIGTDDLDPIKVYRTLLQIEDVIQLLRRELRDMMELGQIK